MSISPLPQAAPLRVLAEVDALLDQANAAPLWPMSNVDTLELVRVVSGVQAKVAGLRLRAVAEVDSRAAALGVGASSTAGWLRGHCGQRPGAARAAVALAEALTRRYPDTLERLCEGLVSEEAARVIAGTLDEVPAGVDAATMAAAEADLLAHARSCMIRGGWRGSGRTCSTSWTPTGPRPWPRRKPGCSPAGTCT